MLKTTLMMLALIPSIALGGETIDPPKKYDHEPTVAYVIVPLTADNLEWICHPQGVPHGMQLEGCVIPAYRSKGKAYPAMIHIDKALTGARYQRVLRHEKAHVNGWKHR